MLNVMEERDIQIRGYVLRLPLDVLVVASANPEDYTNRGRIITPLKDRFGAEIRTHYPTELEDEIAVIRQEAAPRRRGARPPRRDPGPLHPQPARVARRSTSAPASGAVRDRRRRDDRRGGPAPRHRARARTRRWRASSTSRPRSTCSAARSSSRPARRAARREILDPPAAHRHRRDRPRSTSAGIDFALLVDAIEDGAMVTTGEQVTARDFLTGLPVLGESELYDEVCDRLDAHQRRRAGRRHRARARGPLPRPQDQQGVPAAGRPSMAEPDRAWQATRRHATAGTTAGRTRSRRRSTSPRRSTRSART